MTTTRLAEYANGGCLVRLYWDGSKTREWEASPAPLFPESMDLKITNRCGAGCEFCHESSVPGGAHANVEDIGALVDGLPAGVEVAIGGGNPLSHPGLDEILEMLAGRGLVANLTLLDAHVPGSAGRLQRLQRRGLVWGIGVSTRNPRDVLAFPGGGLSGLRNVVFHVIVGVSKPRDVSAGAAAMKRVLILGYKTVGRGETFMSGVALRSRIKEWKFWLPSILRSGAIVAFDNLALRQLGVREYVGEADWSDHFMGRDGSFSLFVDAVRMECAVSSSVERRPLRGRNVIEAFRAMGRGGMCDE